MFGFIVSPNPALEGCMAASASYMASMITIDEVNISGIVEPVEGANPIHSNEGLRADPNLAMFIAGEDNGFFASKTATTLMDDTVPFIQGQTVYFKMNLGAETGYEFATNPKFKYKGAYISSDNVSFDGDIYTVYIPLTVQPLVYSYLSGANLSTSNLDELSFRIDAEYSLFSTGGKVYVDETLVDAANYVATSGSTVITFDEGFAATLSAGEHNLKVEFNNGGEAETTFTILDNQVDNNDTNTDTNNPQTGDNIAMSIVLGLISLIGLIGTTIYIKKRFN